MAVLEVEAHRVRQLTTNNREQSANPDADDFVLRPVECLVVQSARPPGTGGVDYSSIAFLF